LSRAGAPAELAALARARLSPAGQQQVMLCLRMLEATGGELDGLRRQPLADSIYGVGSVTARALTCWLGGAGRFTSARKAVRFAGLDITACSSDGKRSPGHLSRPGPPGLRPAGYEAGRTHAPPPAPDPGHHAALQDRKGGKRA